MRSKTLIGVLFALSALTGTAVAQQQTPLTDLAAVKDLLKEIRVNPYPPPRERSAQLVVAWIRRIDVATIDQATIDEMIALLDDKSDSVRGRMAIALGLIGESAKRSVPALQKAFIKGKEIVSDPQYKQPGPRPNALFPGSSSADSICFALAKLEAMSPPECVDGHYQAPDQPAANPAAN
jgi:hypothetical protein